MKNIIRRIVEYVLLNKNMILNKTYIPNRLEHLYIEVTNTCNLHCKFCAYTKGALPKVSMTNDLFKEVVEKACKYGYSKFGLTPVTGEVFFDKYFLEKLEYLERHHKVESYSFFSNMTLATKDDIDFLVKAKKISHLSISIYGHDEKSFVMVTGKDIKNYFNMIKSLEYLLPIMHISSMKVEIGIRTIGGFQLENCDSELCLILKKYRQKDVPIFITTQYNNWGGLVDLKDVKELGVSLSGKDQVYKKGACSLIFYKNIVLSDGRVNACACRDVNATMVLGDIKQSEFIDIFSNKNKKYINLINAQNRGKFNSICSNCDMYRSIYKYHSIYRYHNLPPISLGKALQNLDH